MSGAIRGGMTTAQAWDAAVNDLCQADDVMEDYGERRMRAMAGVAWAAFAVLARLDDTLRTPTDSEDDS